MKRINTPTASSGKFVDGNPSIGRKATQFNAEWCNNVQEELCNAIHALTGADPTGAAEMNELGAALGGILGKVATSSNDSAPGYLEGKFESVNMTGPSGDIGFVEITTQDGKKIKAVLFDDVVEAKHIKSKSIDEGCIKDREITRPLIAFAAVGGYGLHATVVSESATVSVASGATKTKVCDLDSIQRQGLADITAVVKYGGSGYVPSGVSLTIEDASGRVLRTWSVNGGGSIAGEFTKRMVGRDQGNVAVTGEMLSLYINNGNIGYGWSVSVDVDGIVFR